MSTETAGEMSVVEIVWGKMSGRNMSRGKCPTPVFAAAADDDDDDDDKRSVCACRTFC